MIKLYIWRKKCKSLDYGIVPVKKMNNSRGQSSMSKIQKDSISVIYPLPSHLASRILQDKKSVFVKYPTHGTISSKLTSCKKFLLYISGSSKEIAGEAEVKSISLMTLSEVLAAHDSSLFLTEDELREYSNGRDNKKMMVF
jgi:hypothetical protein